MADKPNWRKIEAALIELLREEGLELYQSKGETSITFSQGDREEDEHMIILADFARQLEERL